MDEILKEVEAFAEKAHGDQTRKYSNERYIAHPVRVMKMCKEYTSSLPMLAAALLHDVLEDTPVTKKELHHFLLSQMNSNDADETIRLVDELTDVYTKEKYTRWNRRKRKEKESLRIEQTSADSQTIKYADIIDNCREIATDDPEFAPVFLKECKMLLKKMMKGHQELYKIAVEKVNTSLKQL
ncbi:MAG TPA: HD domain-containing protein [Flavisolibacter sp.]|nr:HD domain-containing protein [Flavisolibacter sp.]